MIQLIGDRNGNCKLSRAWDAVIDDSAANPEWVRMSTELLKGRVVWWIRRTGPRVSACRRRNMEGFLDQAIKALGSTSKLVSIDDYEFLKAHQIPESVPFIMLEGNDLGHTLSLILRREREEKPRNIDSPVFKSACWENGG